MPRKPKHPCSYPGCPKLTDKRFCEEHEKLSNSNYEKYGRDKSTKKRYGRAWKRIRDKYAAEHPFCEMCFERGIIVPTEEIHHKLPLSEGGTHDRSNLIVNSSLYFRLSVTRLSVHLIPENRIKFHSRYWILVLSK